MEDVDQIEKHPARRHQLAGKPGLHDEAGQAQAFGERFVSADHVAGPLYDPRVQRFGHAALSIQNAVDEIAGTRDPP